MYQGLWLPLLIQIWIVLTCLMTVSNGQSGYCQNYQESWDGELIIPTTTPRSRRYYHNSNQNNREEIKYVQVCEQATKFSLCGTCWKIIYRKSNISVIQTNTYQEASNLKAIQISGLQIERIETGAFAHLPNLRILNLEFNHLGKIARGMFNSLPSLTFLNVSHNLISQVEEESFHGSFKLEGLDLSFNNISFIPNNTFQHSNLLILSMSNNSLSTLADDFCKSVPNLNNLVLDHNLFNRVPSCLNESRVVHLSLKFNSITSLNDTDLPSTLIEFFVSNNKLRFIHKNTFVSLKDLKILDLSDNYLVKIHVECFKNNEKLKSLDISGTGLGNIDPEMLNFAVSLQDLGTARNNISSLPKGIFEKLSTLKNLDLSGNEIDFLQLGLLKDLDSLQTLNLSQNKLEYLQTGVFRGLNTLEVLDLSSNKLEMFRFHNLRSLEKLRLLHLESNLMDIIDASDFENFPKDSHVASLTISLDGNKLPCTILARIISKPNVKLMEGKTFATENIDGISCRDNVTMETKTNIEESLSEIRHFFQNDFKKFLNAKTEGATRQDLREIVEYLHRNFSNHLAENFNGHVKEFMEFENASFYNFLKELDGLVSKLSDESTSLENLSLTLREEMKSFISFENSSFQQFMVKMSEIVDKENRISSPIQSEQLVSTVGTEQSTELIQALNQLKVFMILCTIALLIVVALKMVPRFKKGHWMESERQSHEMPILSFLVRFSLTEGFRSMEMKYLLLMCFITFVSCNNESICKVVSSPAYKREICGNYGCRYVRNIPFENVTCTNLDQMHSTPSLCSEKCTIIFSGENEILRTNSFSLVHNLEQVFLNSTQIKEIQSRSFSGSPSIKLINLAENQIEKIPENTFSHLSNLQYLDLSYNKIEEIEEESFEGCSSLEYLDFSDNNLRNISSRTFESVLKLKTLNLSRNSLEVLDPNWCFHFHSLKTLIVDHNRISTLVNCTANFNIDILSISHNLLEVLNGSSFPTTLKELYLSGNQISKIENKPFQHLSALTRLDISNNQLDHLPFELFVDLKNLTYLDVSSNNLKNLNEGVFHGLVSLNFLNLSNTQTSNLETRVFYSTKKLTEIDMSRNNLIELNIESLLKFCKHLQFLWLDGNSFTCPDLANILFRAEEKSVLIPYGLTYNRRNLNGIECFEETPNISNATKTDQFVNFFKEGFKKSSFFKFFSSFKQPTENNHQELLEVEKDLLKNISEVMEKSERQILTDLSSEDRKKMDNTNKLVQKLIERLESEKGTKKNSNFTSELLTVLGEHNTAALTAENAEIQELTSSLNSLKLMFFVCLLMVVSFGVVKFFKMYNSKGYSRGNQEMRTIPAGSYA